VGEAEAWLRELRRDGMKVPELDEEPKMHRGAEEAWSAFAALNESRPIHFGGAGAIPLSEIEAYCRLVGLEDADEREQLARLVRRADRFYLSHNNSQKEARRG
jgi:hypothetical protein